MTVDVAAFRKQADGSYVNSLADELSSGVEVDGIEKLAQRFVLKLMTRRGSIPYKASEGTLFLSLVVDGRVSSEADVFSAFAAATADIASTMAGEETESDPDEERFSAAILRQLTVQAGSLTLSIEVKNKAGQRTGLQIPLTFGLGY